MLHIKILLYIIKYGNLDQETNCFSYKNIITTLEIKLEYHAKKKIAHSNITRQT